MGFEKFPKIRQFRDAIIAVSNKKSFAGLDELGEPMFIKDATMPVLDYVGTVKMHGTNAAVSMDMSTGEIKAQSRSKIITPTRDNAGFARHVYGIPKESWNTLFYKILLSYFTEGHNRCQIFAYGEWIGPGVQNGVGISSIEEKSFVVFGVLIKSYDTGSYEWVSIDVIRSFSSYSSELSENNIYLITDLAPVYNIRIDFSKPKLIQNNLVDMTMAIEKSCPVAKFFGVDGIGEGIVWRCVNEDWTDTDFWFKTKGDKHSSSKVKTIAEVDVAKVNSVIAFVENSVTERRLEQGIEFLNENQKEISRKSTGDYVRWVVNDVLDEEFAVLYESDLEPKDVTSSIGTAARKWFFNYIDKS